MNDLEALAFSVRVSPELTMRERQFALSVMRFETNYGAGWVGLARKLGLENPEQYADVNNFGAITRSASSSAPKFFMRDRNWARYDSPEAGFKDAARTILKPNVRARVNLGDGAGGIHAMALNKYFIEPTKSTAGTGFGGPPSEQEKIYRQHVARNYVQLIDSTGAERVLSFEPKTLGRTLGDMLEVGAYVAGVIGVIWFFGSGKGGKHGAAV